MGNVATPTIVLLHGQPDTSASFWPLRRELRQRLPADVRVLAPDRPGYGANPLPATGFAGNVSWLRAWLQRIGAGPTVLVGHSWAGGVAALAAAEPSAEATGLVLLASVGPDCVLWTDRLLAAPVLGELIAYTTLRLGRPVVRRRAESVILGALAKVDRPYGRSSGVAMRFRPIWRSFLREQRALLNELAQVNAALPAIRVPAAVISGSSDSMIPSATPTALAAAISDCVQHRLDGGHDLQLREPAAVAQLIAGFVGQLPGFGAADAVPIGAAGTGPNRTSAAGPA